MKKYALLALLISVFMFVTVKAQPAYFKWASQIGANGGDGGRDITVDGQGNVITVGHYAGTVDFNTGPGTAILTTQASTLAELYVLKLDSLSNFLWVKTLVCTATAMLLSVTHDAGGNIYACGRFRGIMDADPGPGTYTIMSTGYSEDAFVTKWSSSGNLIWAKNFGGISDDDARYITVDNTGNVYTTGIFQSTADFDPGPATFSLSSNGGWDIFVSKLDPFGNFLWAGGFGGPGFGSSDIARGIAMHPSGDVLVIGRFSGPCDFDPGPGVDTFTTGPSSNDAFVLRLSTTGNYMWAKRVNSFAGSSEATSIIAANGGDIYCTGNFNSNGSVTDFDPGPGTYTVGNISPSNSDGYVQKLDGNGNFIWAKTYGGSSFNYPGTIALDLAENIYITGSAGQGTGDLDPGPGLVPYTAASTGINYLLELNQQGIYVWSHVFGPGTVGASAVYVDPQAMIYLTGYFEGTVDFDPGITTYTQQALATTLTTFPQYLGDVFVLKLRLTCAATAPLDVTPLPSKNICFGDVTVLSASGTGNIYWYTTPTSSLAVASGPNYTVAPTSVGTKTYFAGISTCVQSQTRAAVVVTVNACVGIEHKDQIKELSIFPNPANQYVTINSENYGEISKADLFDNTGRLLKTYLNFESENKIDLCEMSTGLYFLTIYFQNGEKCSKKIMVAH